MRGPFTFLQTKKGAVLPAHSFVPTPFISQLIFLMKPHPAVVLATILSDLCLSLDTGVILAISEALTSRLKLIRTHARRTKLNIKLNNINELHYIDESKEPLTRGTFQ
jgi:hypothetical protein